MRRRILNLILSLRTVSLVTGLKLSGATFVVGLKFAGAHGKALKKRDSVAMARRIRAELFGRFQQLELLVVTTSKHSDQRKRWFSI